jgi:membrane-associated progesterone receptor component
MSRWVLNAAARVHARRLVHRGPINSCSCSKRARMEAELHLTSITAVELAQCNGLNTSKLYVAMRCSAEPHSAVIYDVSDGAEFYGPGGPYDCFAGRDCSRAFSLGSLSATDLHADMSQATMAEWLCLDDWHEKLSAKYPVVGRMPADSPFRLADLPERPRRGAKLPQDALSPDIVHAVEVMAERSGLGAEEIAAILQIDVEATKAVLAPPAPTSPGPPTLEQPQAQMILEGWDDDDEWRVVQ